jgi:O-antigen/teichoic acid export membrane protein
MTWRTCYPRTPYRKRGSHLMTVAVQEQETVLKEIRTAVRHMAVYGLGGILVKLAGFLMLPFYTRYLSPADYGVLEILDLSMSVFGIVLSMGMIPAFLRCYATATGEAEKRRVVSTGCTFGVATGVLAFVTGVALVRPLNLLLFGPTVPARYLLLSFIALILTYMANLPRTYLRALEASGTYTVVDTAYVLLLLVLNVLFIVVLKIGLAGMLWSSVIAGALQFVLLSTWAFWKAGVRFHWPYLRRMLDFGLPLIFANVALFVLNFSDRFFLQHLRSLDVVGVYAVGYKFGYMLNFLLVQPFFVMWQSRMYVIHAQPEHPRIFRQIFSLYSLGMVFVWLAMSLFSSEVIGVIVQPKFAASQEVIPVVALAYIFYGLSYYAQLGMFLTDNTRRIGFIGILSAAVNLALNFVLISLYGMMGAAWATVWSFAFMAGVSYVFSQRSLRMPLGIGRAILGISLAIGLYLFCRWWFPVPGGSAILGKLVALAVFPVLVWKSGILTPEAATVVSSAGGAALGVMSRAYAGVARRAVSQ